ncbi:hypothetical protein [Halosolutus gelatinilyticus]|uniref:hypothetical protein n=1 Tax=Halosolutus gelatinilyticus TaxID=2931975 RepID=UPI001FF2AD10|nr:hypothetical protein [Halosolutus gelatinilyticus]
MTAVDDRAPATTARAIAVAAAVGALALASSHPMAAAGGLLGVAIAAVSRGFGGSYRRVTLVSAFLPALALGSIAVVVGASGPVGVVLTIAIAIAGAAAVVVVAGRPSSSALERAGAGATATGVATAVAAILCFGVYAAGDPRSALATVLWLTGDGVSGLLGWCLVAGVAAVLGAFAVPPAALSTPAELESYARRRTAIAWAIGIGTASAVGFVAAATVLTWLVASLDPVLAALADSGAVRGILASAAGASLAIAVVGTAIQKSWSRATRRNSVAVPVVVGGVCGVLLVVPVAVVATGGRYDVAAGLLTAATIVLGGGYTAAAIALGAMNWDWRPAPTSAIAAALVAGGLVLAGTADAAPGLETIRTALVSFVAIAAGLFAYDVGRYGRTLGREIGRDGSSRRPQLIRIGWSGGVAAIGVPVATVGALGAAVLAPALSIPATAGALGGLAALVAGGWLLFR